MRNWPFVTRAFAELLEQELELARAEVARLREENQRLVGSLLMARGSTANPFAPPPSSPPPRPIGPRSAESILRALEQRDAELTRKMNEEPRGDA